MHSSSKSIRRIGWGLLAVTALYALLLIPEPNSPAPKGAGKQVFRWNRDAFWGELEKKFQRARAVGCEGLEQPITESLSNINWIAWRVNQKTNPLQSDFAPNAPIFESLETNLLNLAPMIGACPKRLPEFLNAFSRMRTAVKYQSYDWPANEQTHERLYRLLYGGRAAVEEAMLQAPRERSRPLLEGMDVSSDQLAAQFDGVSISNGDILLSRGGAATSALIARGNDYPGNFSHVALVHVDRWSKKISVIEAHIESGVKVTPFENYLKDKKLRILLLRPWAALGDRAADDALEAVQEHHIPYDFAMDHNDPRKQFCSEVASAAYAAHGINLWPTLSHISSPGTIAWLSTLGVRNFESQEPSDLEYSPLVSVVAEWRDPETLFKDHVDNAVTDALLEGAENGDKLGYNIWKLPPARLAKAWSWLKNCFGGVGPVPEGMSATTALRVDYLTKTHAAIYSRVIEQAEKFKTERGYVPPYWELVRMARKVKAGLQSNK